MICDVGDASDDGDEGQSRSWRHQRHDDLIANRQLLPPITFITLSPSSLALPADTKKPISVISAEMGFLDS